MSSEIHQFVLFVHWTCGGFVPWTNVLRGPVKYVYTFISISLSSCSLVVAVRIVVGFSLISIACVKPIGLQNDASLAKETGFHTMGVQQARKNGHKDKLLVRTPSGGVGVFYLTGWGPKSLVCPS